MIRFSTILATQDFWLWVPNYYSAFFRYGFQRSIIWCGLSGISSFVSLSGGIPAQIFLLPHGLARQSFVGTLCVYFFVINIVKIPFYIEIGIFSESTLTISLWLLLVIPIGVFIGKWLNTHLNDQIFYDISHLGLLAMGTKLLLSIFQKRISTKIH